VKLESRRKLPGRTRVASAAETIQRATPLARAYGVTRVADITGLDRLGIPVYCAIAPRTRDFLSVYSGKGAEPEDAMAGALMEAIERQANLRAEPKMVRASAQELRRREAIVEPTEILTSLGPEYRDDRRYEWLEGFDLLNEAPAFVPASFAGYRWKHLRSGSIYQRTTTNGLAAGNCLEEAVAQALCECVERDGWTLAELACHWRPRAEVELERGADPGMNFVDDLDRCPLIDLDGISPAVEALLARFHKAGLDPLVRDASSDLGIPVVLAAIAEDEMPGFPQAHLGIGSHPDLAVAVARALTEVAQSRAGDIQGMREDLAPPDGGGDSTGVAVHTRRVESIDRRRWVHGRSSFLRPWRQIEQHRHADVLEDIRLLLARLRRAGIRQAVVVDFSPAGSGLHVVRVVVPGLEMWIADHGLLGDRATAAWRAENRRLYA
jgi:ribosomal protein S12 methylthiotransferase accessory factor